MQIKTVQMINLNSEIDTHTKTEMYTIALCNLLLLSSVWLAHGGHPHQRNPNVPKRPVLPVIIEDPNGDDPSDPVYRREERLAYRSHAHTLPPIPPPTTTVKTAPEEHTVKLPVTTMEPHSAFITEGGLEDDVAEGDEIVRRVRQDGGASGGTGGTFPPTAPPSTIPPIDFAWTVINFYGSDTKTAPSVPKYRYRDCRTGNNARNRATCAPGMVCISKQDGRHPPSAPPPPGLGLTCDGITPENLCLGCDPAKCPVPADEIEKGSTCGSAPSCPYPMCDLPKNYSQDPVKDPLTQCDYSGIQMDGYCVDTTMSPDKYESTITPSPIPDTPMVFFRGKLPIDAQCSAYGDSINDFLRSSLPLNEKKRIRTDAASILGTDICNWAETRLECIPKEIARPTLPPFQAAPATPGGVASLTADQWNAYRQRAGTCKCMIGLGQNAVYVKDEAGVKPACFIPAAKGHDSDCDHEIFLPYGAMDFLTKQGLKISRGILGEAKDFCVPNAECRPGYTYVGLRCACKKGYKLDIRGDGTCSSAKGIWRLSNYEKMKTLAALLIPFVFKMMSN